MWKAKLKNNEIVSELTHQWTNIKDQVCELLLITKNQQIITLPPNMDKYIQFKTASAIMGSNNIEIESRTIGYHLGNNIVTIKVNEKTNNISVETK